LYALLHLDMKYQRNPRQLMNVGQRSSLIRPRYWSTSWLASAQHGCRKWGSVKTKLHNSICCKFLWQQVAPQALFTCCEFVVHHHAHNHIRLSGSSWQTATRVAI